MKQKQIEALAVQAKQVKLAITFTQRAKTFVHYFQHVNGYFRPFKSEYENLNDFLKNEAPEAIKLGLYWNHTNTRKEELA
jgi:hypothetical protein